MNRRPSLLDELEAFAPGGSFAPGQIYARTVQTSDGLEVELTVTVRRRPELGQVAEYRAAALAELEHESSPHWSTCGSYIKKRNPYSRSSPRCEGRIVAVVAYSGAYGGAAKPRFLFICGRHREHHGVDPARILAVVELPPSALDPVMKVRKARAAEWRAKWLGEDHQKGEHERGKEPGCPSCYPTGSAALTAAAEKRVRERDELPPYVMAALTAAKGRG